jgi:hypothetical protein
VIIGDVEHAVAEQVDEDVLRAYPAWRDPRVDGEAFFVIDEGG